MVGNMENTDLSLAKVELDHINKVLTMTGGSMTSAAKLLGISRATLYRKVKPKKSRLPTGNSVG